MNITRHTRVVTQLLSSYVYYFLHSDDTLTRCSDLETRRRDELVVMSVDFNMFVLSVHQCVFQPGDLLIQALVCLMEC